MEDDPTGSPAFCSGDAGCSIPSPSDPDRAPDHWFLPTMLCKMPCVTYVIAQPCVDVVDRACVDECPVDCIYQGARSLYIQPDECIDCGACEPVCPVEAIYYEDDLPAPWAPYLADNDAFFSEALAGRAAPLGSPGGAAKVGALGVDTTLVSSLRREGV